MTENNNYIRKGDIFYVYLGNERNNHVQCGGINGMRPCLIVNNNVACVYSPVLLVVPITSSERKMQKLLPTHLVLQDLLPKKSVAMFEQVLTVNREQLSNKIGSVSDSMISRINQKLEIAFGLCPQFA